MILACSALEAQALPAQVDWVVSRDYAELIQNHPRIRTVYAFDRAAGFRGWLDLCRFFWNRRYDEVYDLHGSMRTRVMRVLFLFWGLREASLGKSQPGSPRWFKISKQKIRLWGYLTAKQWWPRAWRPEAWVSRFARAVGGTGAERPNLRHLCHVSPVSAQQLSFDLNSRWVCVMPSSRWNGKKWPVSYYAQLIAKMGAYPVVLGSKKDAESFQLCEELERMRIPYFSAVGQWNLSFTAWALSQAPGGYLGCDTGLAHLAEAVGARAQVIFGPTSPEMGFGPWRTESRSIQSAIVCRPCSRNGRFCYRFGQPYECLRGLTAEAAHAQIMGGQA